MVELGAREEAATAVADTTEDVAVALALTEALMWCGAVSMWRVAAQRRGIVHAYMPLHHIVR
jgi:hypothetical protein